MPNHQRDAAIKRLRAAAEDVLSDQRNNLTIVHIIGKKRIPIDRRRWPSFLAMAKAWKAFPECERDEVVPSPEEVIARCDAYDRQKEEQERLAK